MTLEREMLKHLDFKAQAPFHTVTSEEEEEEEEVATEEATEEVTEVATIIKMITSMVEIEVAEEDTVEEVVATLTTTNQTKMSSLEVEETEEEEVEVDSTNQEVERMAKVVTISIRTTMLEGHTPKEIIRTSEMISCELHPRSKQREREKQYWFIMRDMYIDR